MRLRALAPLPFLTALLLLAGCAGAPAEAPQTPKDTAADPVPAGTMACEAIEDYMLGSQPASHALTLYVDTGRPNATVVALVVAHGNDTWLPTPHPRGNAPPGYWAADGGPAWPVGDRVDARATLEEGGQRFALACHGVQIGAGL